MKRFFFWVIGAVIGVYVLSVVTDNDHVWTGLRQCYMRGYKTAQIDDMRFQSLRSIPASSDAAPLATAQPIRPSGTPRCSRGLHPPMEHCCPRCHS